MYAYYLRDNTTYCIYYMCDMLIFGTFEPHHNTHPGFNENLRGDLTYYVHHIWLQSVSKSSLIGSENCNHKTKHTPYLANGYFNYLYIPYITWIDILNDKANVASLDFFLRFNQFKVN